MSPEEAQCLLPNDQIRHKLTGNIYRVATVPANGAGEITLTRTVVLTNPRDWSLVEKDAADRQPTEQFTLEDKTIYDAGAGRSIECEDVATAQKLLKMLKDKSVTPTSLTWDKT